MSTQDLREQLQLHQGRLRVWASDAESHPAHCGVFSAAKARRDFAVEGWERRYGDEPFMLGVIRDIVVALHRDVRTITWEGLQEALNEQMALRSDNLHPGLRRYVAHAVEQYLDAHDALEAQHGEMRFTTLDPVVGGQGREIKVWAFLYSNGDGVREIRRLRMKRARSRTEESDRGATVAGYVAARLQMRVPPTGIRVVEVGLQDGSTEVVLEHSYEDALALYEAQGRPVIRQLISPTDYGPGPSCQKCKLAGRCPSLQDLTDCLGQRRPGPSTRSVSAADLELYSKCAARWYLDMQFRLPTEDNPSEASDRGRIIHRWLDQAHTRGTQCTERDVAPPDQEGVFTGSLTADEYAKAREFLVAHSRSCPLAEGSEVIAVEPPVYGYDAKADVIVAARPDLVYRDPSGRVVVRETKTTTQMPADESDAFDRFFPIPWLINIARTAKDAFGESDTFPRIELEVITPSEARVFTWDVERDQDMVRMAQAEVQLRTRTWIRDTSWAPSPGAQCTWCPVRRWCPDAADLDYRAHEQPQSDDEPCAGLPTGSPE
ncbi:PD-(D/E)XK nuclease family protein [Streptomyces sp. NBC_00328]|uniref:PD-(D/E)XK nuclease family protein n=1 Tax=Streptomyces sp. NBC_00328 TaxID=2903646 RepID=UPI002E2CD8FA|nr:PD-(D/E)XK nuclease family protein [Streptomyces sp. NBC_00328]